MPWITINMMAGHNDEEKKTLHQKVAAAVCESLSVPPEWVKIQLVEMNEADHSIGGVQVKDL